MVRHTWGERIEDHLKTLGVRVPDLKAGEQYRATSERATLLADDRFDPFVLLANHLRLIEEARRDRFAGVRLVMDMSWLLDSHPDPAPLLKYEAICDSVFTFHHPPMIAIAQYSAARLGERLATDLIKLHPFAYIGRYLKRIPFYHHGGPDGPGPAAPAASMPGPHRPRRCRGVRLAPEGVGLAGR